MLQRNGGCAKKIRDRVKRAAIVIKHVWGVGKRRFGRGWGRKIWLFDRLAWTVMAYGVEVWG